MKDEVSRAPIPPGGLTTHSLTSAPFSGTPLPFSSPVPRELTPSPCLGPPHVGHLGWKRSLLLADLIYAIPQLQKNYDFFF